MLLAVMSPADPPIVASSGRRAYGWPRGQEFQQLLHFVLAGVALVLFDRENALGRHLCFRKAAYADKHSLFARTCARALAGRSSGLLQRHTLFGQFLFCILILRQVSQTHSTQYIGCLRKLNVVIANDLHAVAPGVPEIKERPIN